ETVSPFSSLSQFLDSLGFNRTVDILSSSVWLAFAVETALVLLFSELENAEFFVPTDGASELVSEGTRSKLDTVRIVAVLLGAVRVLGDGETCDGECSGCNLFLIADSVGEATGLLAVRPWRWT